MVAYTLLVLLLQAVQLFGIGFHGIVECSVYPALILNLLPELFICRSVDPTSTTPPSVQFGGSGKVQLCAAPTCLKFFGAIFEGWRVKNVDVPCGDAPPIEKQILARSDSKFSGRSVCEIPSTQRSITLSISALYRLILSPLKAELTKAQMLESDNKSRAEWCATVVNWKLCSKDENFRREGLCECLTNSRLGYTDFSSVLHTVEGVTQTMIVSYPQSVGLHRLCKG